MRSSDFIFKSRVRNWPGYNKALISRGTLTLWVEECCDARQGRAWSRARIVSRSAATV